MPEEKVEEDNCPIIQHLRPCLNKKVLPFNFAIHIAFLHLIFTCVGLVSCLEEYLSISKKSSIVKLNWFMSLPSSILLTLLKEMFIFYHL